MRRTLMRGCVRVALLTSALSLRAPQSYAEIGAVDAMVVAGAGQILPGVTVLPANEALSFQGIATVAGHEGIATTYSCSFNGNGTDSWTEGIDFLSGSCGPISLSFCALVRVGTQVTIGCIQTGSPDKVATGEFEWVPTQTPPATITSYTMLGVAAYTGVE